MTAAITNDNANKKGELTDVQVDFKHNPFFLLTFSIIVCIFIASTHNHPMKKLLTFLAIVFFVGQAGAQTMDYLQQKDFQAEKKKIYDGINASRKQVSEIKKDDVKIVSSIDSIKLILGKNSVQLSSNNDSLAQSNAMIKALKEQFDNQKLLPRSFLILLFVIILIMFVVVFIVLFLFNKKAETNQLSIADLDIKINERIDMEVKSLTSDIQSIREAIHSLSTELGHKMSTGFISLEAKNHQSEKQLREDMAGIEVKFSTFGPEISKLKDEQSIALKSLEDKFHNLKREADLLHQGLAVRTTKLEERLK